MHNKPEHNQETTIIKLVKTKEAKMPVRATKGSAGYDLCSVEEIELLSGEYKMVPTGLRLEIPPGFEAQVRPRSGLAARHGIGVLNSPGTIDSDYRGEVKVILINHGQKPFKIEKGMRIAQMVFASLTDVALELEDNLSSSTRGEGGFGSTGTKTI
jgi:dUTP pyrophosphatase